MIKIDEIEAAKYLLDASCQITLGDLVLLAKYFKYKGVDDVSGSLKDYIQRRTFGYNEVKYDKYVGLAVQNAEENNLRTDITIGLTEKELRTIKEIGDPQVKKILFCLVCVSKYYFLHPAHIGCTVEQRKGKRVYVNNSLRDIFDLAHVSYNKEERDKVTLLLINKGLLEISPTYKLIINCVDVDGDSVINLDLHKDFVYFLYSLDGEKVINCEKCGCYLHINNHKANHQKYCTKCAKEIVKERDRERKRNISTNQKTENS